MYLLLCAVCPEKVTWWECTTEFMSVGGEALQEGYLLLDCGSLGSSGMCRASLSTSLPGCALGVKECEQNFGQRWFYKDNLSKFNLQAWVVSLWDGKFRIADAPSISSFRSVVVMEWQPWGEPRFGGFRGVSPFPN